ncbi:MAG: imidazole glycerol phosphate synthase subunit HisH [Marivibrio sp.]|uniref:imidazole glycerol phosphate synthase subunit HisH n=1 Tax=Marivibrio sp. TaxID=2039719 RepID=UPI0032EABE3A
MSVVIVDYGSGNLRSAAKAFERMADARVEIQVTDDVARIAAADRLVLPGVGAFGDCRRGLAAVDGAIEALEEAVIQKGRPFLGICVGMQLMADEGREHGTHSGLGWIPGAVDAVRPADPALKVPHMGWNLLDEVADHPVFAGLSDGAHYAYFVHSYHLTPVDPAHRLASVEYGGRLTAAVGRDNMVGVQFHPEKSQAAGLRLIANFLEWRP